MLSGRSTTKPPAGSTLVNTLQPDAPFFAIGDLHGRLDLLEKLVSKLDLSEGKKVVFLGDYIDRGDQSAQTLDYLFQISRDFGDQVICLMGNHEKMMFDFIDDPIERGSIWLRNGGLATLASYGIKGVLAKAKQDEALEVSATFEAALPEGLLKWMRKLPLSWNSGNIWCVHAAMDPSRAPQAQDINTLLWGHRAFLETPRDDGICVVHGHTIVDAPFNMNSRISIDTGAYKSGQLTAAYIAERECNFIST
jgi:serine/threonine protein phosphatase 1